MGAEALAHGKVVRADGHGDAQPRQRIHRKAQKHIHLCKITVTITVITTVIIAVAGIAQAAQVKGPLHQQKQTNRPGDRYPPVHRQPRPLVRHKQATHSPLLIFLSRRGPVLRHAGAPSP